MQQFFYYIYSDSEFLRSEVAVYKTSKALFQGNSWLNFGDHGIISYLSDVMIPEVVKDEVGHNENIAKI